MLCNRHGYELKLSLADFCPSTPKNPTQRQVPKFQWLNSWNGEHGHKMMGVVILKVGGGRWKWFGFSRWILDGCAYFKGTKSHLCKRCKNDFKKWSLDFSLVLGFPCKWANTSKHWMKFSQLQPLQIRQQAVQIKGLREHPIVTSNGISLALPVDAPLVGFPASLAIFLGLQQP